MGIKESLEGLGKKLGQQPWYVWAGVVGGAGLIGYYVLKKRAAAANTQQSYATPGAADQAALDQALNGVQLSNMAGIPYGYQNSYGPVDNYPQTTASNSTPATTETGAADTSSSNTSVTGSTNTTSTPTPTHTTTGNNTVVQSNVQSNNSSGQQDPNPYAGLLGPNVAVDFQKRTFTSPTVKNPTHLPIPDGDRLVQGSQNRVWYIENNIQHLLTDGNGPPVTNSGFPVNSPQNTPGAYGGGHVYESFHVPVNSIRNTVWDLTSAGIGHADLGYEL